MRSKFIYQDERSNKFWDIEITGNELTVYFGKAGTQGQTQTKAYASPEECNKAAEKLIVEKLKKGYSRVAEEKSPEPNDATPLQYTDLLALAGSLVKSDNEGLELVPVTEENIEEMESAAGFQMPEAYVDFWLEKGSLFYSKDDFICTVYCFNAEGPNGNNLHSFLTFYQNFYRCKFKLLDEERVFLSQCYWVLGMIINGDEQHIFVSDPLGEVRSIHFPAPLRNMGDEAFLQALSPILEAKNSLKSLMGSAAFQALLDKAKDNSNVEEPVSETIEETQTSLEQYGIKAISYDELLTQLNVDHLFDYWEENADNCYADDYESEREYFEDHDAIYYYDGDLNIDGDLVCPDLHIDLLAVRGNMTIEGKIRFGYGTTPYYVTGNTTIDYLQLGYFQKTVGLETVRYVAYAWGEDDEMIHTMPSRNINAPFFFSWYYDLYCFDFAPQTVITALYDWDKLTSYKTANTFLRWHDYAYAIRPDFYYDVTNRDHNNLSISTETIYKALKNNQPVLLEGVTPEGIKLTRESISLKEEGDIASAYRHCKEAITKAPDYYPAYYLAGKCLFDQKAYGQAMEMFAKGIPHTPEKVAYEYDCMEQAALCAVRIGEYDKAIGWAKAALQKNESANFALRVLGEALICQNKPDEAKGYLEKSLEIRSFFTANWLLGLIYYFQGDQKNADKFYKAAEGNSSKAQPYTLHTDLHYLYGDPVTVDWDTQRPASKVKDQAYWDQYFADMLAQYGPDLYNRTGKFPLDWLTAKMSTIPEQYRTKDMLQSLLDHQTKGEYDVDGQVIRFFSPEHYTQTIILQAVNREEPCRYSDIPAAFLTLQIFQVHPHGIDLSYMPKELLTYDLCFQAVSKDQYNYNHIPAAFKDEQMNIALIAGGNLQNFHCKDLPSKYYTNQYIKQAIDLGIHAITNIPVNRVDKEIYEYAAGKYGQDPEWPFIVEQYDRERWYWGSQSYVAGMGKSVQKYGIEIFDHIDVGRINKHSYGYYKKHLGHLPEFNEKASAFGWDERSNVTSEYIAQPEFDYDIFDKVWPCFWDEDFIIKAITANKPNSSERIYDVPPQYLTQKICDIAVQRNSYDFQFVPKHLVTQQMCEIACSSDYGNALEFVPLSMRNQQVCEAAIMKDESNIKFVPVRLRSTRLCMGVILRANELSRYVPHEHYAEVFQSLSTEFKNRFSPGYLFLHWGLGLIMNKNHEAARKKLAEVETIAAVDPAYLHQAVYYIGWSYFLEGDVNKANEYWRKSQEIAKSAKIEDEYWLTYAYAAFQLPVVPEVYEFYKEEFDLQMREAALLVQDKNYTEAIGILDRAEKQLSAAQCTEMSWWAYVWDYQRYALYEAGRKEESFALCRKIIDELNKVTLWDYLEEFNPIRAALRSAHNNLAYHCYETATDLKGLQDAIKHIKTTMKTIAPVEEKSVLNLFYETYALILNKAMGFDPAYKKDLEKVVSKINKFKLKEDGLLSEEFIEKVKL